MSSDSSTDLRDSSFPEISSQDNLLSSSLDGTGTSQPPSDGEASKSDDTHAYRLIHDPIYGSVTIDSACAIEIMDLPEFQRLKKVLQHGITSLIGCLPRPPVNRFDHSVGAMLLVKHVGGSEEAQLAALLHDVAHTTLSHVLDLVFGYVIHEVEKKDFLDSTTIREILTKHGFDPERVLEEENFPLLELPSPDICADRLDYALRDSTSFGFLSIEEAQSIFRSTVAIDGHMVLNSIPHATILANTYLQSDQYAWANPTQKYLYQLTSEAIRLMLDLGKINKECLWQLGDEEFWARLTSNATPSLQTLLEKINNRCELSELGEGFQPDSDSSETEICTFKLKVRTIDPLVQTSDGVRRLSEVDSVFAERRLEYIKSREMPQTFVVKYLPAV